MAVATIRVLPRAGTTVAAAGAARTAVTTVLRRRFTFGRALLLSDLIARLLPLLRRHLAPALHVLLEAGALVGAHGLVALQALAKELLLLLRQPLEALMGSVQLALPLRGQRLEALEVFLHAGTVCRRHAAQALVVLPRRLAFLGREALPLAIVLERALPLLRAHLPPPLQVALGLRAILGGEPIEPAHCRLTRRGSGLRRGRRRRRRRLGEGEGRQNESRGQGDGAERASPEMRQHVTSPPSWPEPPARSGRSPAPAGCSTSDRACACARRRSGACRFPGRARSSGCSAPRDRAASPRRPRLPCPDLTGSAGRIDRSGPRELPRAGRPEPPPA